jgi:hypothetical protein
MNVLAGRDFPDSYEHEHEHEHEHDGEKTEGVAEAQQEGLPVEPELSRPLWSGRAANH